MEWCLEGCYFIFHFIVKVRCQHPNENIGSPLAVRYFPPPKKNGKWETLPPLTSTRLRLVERWRFARREKCQSRTNLLNPTSKLNSKQNRTKTHVKKHFHPQTPLI